MRAHTHTSHAGALQGARDALPIVLGYVPIGFAYGVLARKSGISHLDTVLMSVLVFAGSAQFIAVGLLAAGASALSVVATTFVVNLRHLLMTAALSPHLRGWGKGRLALFAAEVTDETFALHAARFSAAAPETARAFASNATAHASWVAGTLLGVAASGLVADVRPLGLDYALPAMFIALLCLQLKGRSHVTAAVAGGVVSVALSLAGLEQSNVIIATLVAASVGHGVDSWLTRAS
jgi:4-azaleucine resistance transporter AzlC